MQLKPRDLPGKGRRPSFWRCFHHHGLILAVGDAIPLIGAAQHLDGGFLFADELTDHQRQEILALERVLFQILVQPAGKTSVASFTKLSPKPQRFMLTGVSPGRSVQLLPPSSV